jgi:hypothetical protein
MDGASKTSLDWEISIMTASSSRRQGNGDIEKKMQITSLHLPTDLLYILRMVAVSRASKLGGRPSVSDVVRGFLESHRSRFDAEAFGRSDTKRSQGQYRARR